MNLFYRYIINQNFISNCVRTVIFTTVVNRMKLVLFTFIDNLLTRNHSVINSLFIIAIIVLILRSARKMFVSSANKTSWTNTEALQISLIYNRNNNGPRTEPCGTPQVIGRYCGVQSSRHTY